jgi:hypothetical protein
VARSVLRAEAELRDYLHAQARNFMHTMVDTLLADGPESTQYAYGQLSGRVDALAAGEAVTLHRYELPDDHPMAPPQGGHPCDNLLLDADNVLRAVTTKHGGAQGF